MMGEREMESAKNFSYENENEKKIIFHFSFLHLVNKIYDWKNMKRNSFSSRMKF